MPGSAPQKAEVTRLLKDWRAGRPEAAEELFVLVYSELKRVARTQLSREGRRHTLQPTELVNEAFLKLVDQRAAWQNRMQFYAIAARAMRRILVDHARRRLAAKRPQDGAAVDLDKVDVGQPAGVDNILIIDEALGRLAKKSRRQARIAELRIFCELELEEIAKLLDTSLSTVKRDWAEAKEVFAMQIKT